MIRGGYGIFYDRRTPYIQQWGTNVQWAASSDMMVEVGYVGTKGVALPDRRAINQAVLASPANPVNGQTTNTSANTQLRVPYTEFSPAGLLAEETAADSHYHSLQASVTRRTSRGLRFQASYPYSKSMDDTSGGSTTLFSEITGDESNMGSSKGLSGFDRTHRLMINSSYEIPRWGFGWNNTAIGKRLFAGWQISGILRRRQDGNRVYFPAETACPIFPELGQILFKTMGVVEALRKP
jgi:hypothetical protein